MENLKHTVADMTHAKKKVSGDSDTRQIRLVPCTLYWAFFVRTVAEMTLLKRNGIHNRIFLPVSFRRGVPLFCVNATSIFSFIMELFLTNSLDNFITNVLYFFC